jgi:hypothetical protein
MHEGILTINFETGLYEILLKEFDERLALIEGDAFSILVDGLWKDTKIRFSETEDDWILEGIDSDDWGLDSEVRIELLFEE